MIESSDRQPYEVQTLHHPVEVHSSTLQVTISGSGSSDYQRVPSALSEAVEEHDESPPASSTQSTLAEAHFHDPTNTAASARTKPSAPLGTRSYYSNRLENALQVQHRRQDASKLPYLSLAEALKWKRISENNVRGEQLKHEQYLDRLRDRHIVSDLRLVTILS